MYKTESFESTRIVGIESQLNDFLKKNESKIVVVSTSISSTRTEENILDKNEVTHYCILIYQIL
jgi:hypothetical protein